MAAKRILIIEDDVDLCEQMAEALSYEGFCVEYAEDALRGEALIREESFDVILLDYKMPLRTGGDILKQLKADNIRKRVLIVSGSHSVEQALKEDGVDDMVSGIIAKPINLELLIEKLKE